MTGIYEISKEKNGINTKIQDVEGYEIDFSIIDKYLLDFFSGANKGDKIIIRCVLPE